MELENIKPLRAIRPSLKNSYIVHDNLIYRSGAGFHTLENTKDRISHIFSMTSQNFLETEDAPCYYVLRIAQCFIGLIGLVPLDSVRSTIFCHEKTLFDKQRKQEESFSSVAIQVNPILLLYRYSSEIEAVLNRIVLNPPDLKIILTDLEHYEMWIIKNDDQIQEISQLYYSIHRFYVADGHHRIAAAYQLREREPYLLSILAADNKVKINSYHRLLMDLNNLSPQEFLRALNAYFDIKEIPCFDGVLSKNTFVLYIDKQFYRLNLKKSLFATTESNFDVNIVNEYIFLRILRMNEKTLGTSIRYFSNSYQISNICQKIDSHAAKAALFLPALEVEDFFSICDAQKILPANSTWFEPKIPDGLICYKRELEICSIKNTSTELVRSL